MNTFESQESRIAHDDDGDGDPINLPHGFGGRTSTVLDFLGIR